MILPSLSLNSLRTFEAAARHLHFTRAANELCVTQAAVSHQIKALEAQLGKPLFERTARGLRLSDAGATLAPALQQAFAQLAQALQALDDGAPPERLCVGVVGTFLHGHLLARLPDFERQHPCIDLQLRTHNNKLDLLVEGLDAAIRFGDGAWRSEAATAWAPTPLSPLCSPELAQRLQAPADLRHCTLLRSFRTGDWPAWAQAAGVRLPTPRGPQFDSSVLMVQAAVQGAGVALAPPALFERERQQGLLAQPFEVGVDAGRYWLTQPVSREPSPALRQFRDWLLATMPA
jgi:LysR family transcriptional regulator, regulator of gene expression of beta-lactamase